MFVSKKIPFLDLLNQSTVTYQISLEQIWEKKALPLCMEGSLGQILLLTT